MQGAARCSGQAQRFLIQMPEEIEHGLVSFLGQLTGSGGVHAGSQVFQLAQKFVAGCVVWAATMLLAVAATVGANELLEFWQGMCPQAIAPGGGKGDGPGYAHCADGIQFVGIVQAAGFDGLRLGRDAETMRFDAVGYGIDKGGGGIAQQGAGLFRSSQMVVFALVGNIVQQGRGTHDGQVCAFGPGQAFCQSSNAQGMIECVGGIGVLVEGAGQFEGDVGHKMNALWES